MWKHIKEQEIIFQIRILIFLIGSLLGTLTEMKQPSITQTPQLHSNTIHFKVCL